MFNCRNQQWFFWSILVAVASWGDWPNGLALGQIKLATDRPQPHSPEESIRMMRVPKGFRVETASEPLLADPTDMAFDAQGRLFVCELHGYNLEGYYDILELNKTGQLDTKVRRVDASPEAQRRADAGQYGTVKLLEDTNGDGRFDKVTVWADHLPCCYGLAPAKDGVVVVCPPDIIYLGDADGDGKPEIKQKLGETGSGPMWDRPSCPRWNIDNWYYCDGGFRFRVDGSAVEPATGTGQFGQTTTDWGDRFYIVQVEPVRYVVPLPYRYLARNPYHGARVDTVSLLTYNDVYPISKPDPWRQKRGADPEWVKFYGVAETTPNGFITSACGPLIYRGNLFPAEYQGNHFCCENAQNFIHRCLLERDGAGYRVKRQPNPKTEFLASTEEWFRPINLALGPDGAMYIVDMYREIIEDYSAIPRFLQQQYVESLIAGHDKGRIYRLTVQGAPPWRPVNLRKAPAAELVQHLANENPWFRETAQRVLVERGDRSAVAPLRALLRTGKTPQARLHALCTLDGLKALFARMSSTPNRASVLQRYLSALSLNGNEARGRKVFEKECAKCHKVSGLGFEVGPDLSVTKTRADETLIGDIMDPSRVLTVNYRNYTVITQNGRIFNGVLAAESATSITLRKEEAAEQTILRKDIDEMAASAISMMPEDLEKVVSPQDVADLLAFLRRAYLPALSLTREPVVVLFEDDPAILAQLTDGPGKGEIRQDDRFSGKACLVIQPFQRAAARIEGWSFRIAENPGPGEFRFLRFAWKAKGEGIMLELAADGQWPGPKEALRRYYSGRNTSGWAAVQVAAQPPRDWTVVTCDLWKDFGSFLLTGMAPTAMGGEARFDRIELLRWLPDSKNLPKK